MDSLLVKVIVQFLYTVLTLFGGGVHTSPTSEIKLVAAILHRVLAPRA